MGAELGPAAFTAQWMAVSNKQLRRAADPVNAAEGMGVGVRQFRVRCMLGLVPRAVSGAWVGLHHRPSPS